MFGVDGSPWKFIPIEIKPISDGPNMVPFNQLEDLVRDLVAFDKLAKQTAVAAE